MYRLRLNRCVQAYRLRTDRAGASRASCDERYLTTVPCRGSFAQGGVTMRDCSTNRAGFDRVLMAVAATFLTVSATSALAAQSTTPRASAAELAIDAAVPRPEPANVPPPTIGDFKMDTTASVPDAAKAVDKPTRAEPDRKGSRAQTRRVETAHRDLRPTTPQPPRRRACDRHRARRRTRQGAGEGCSNVAPADQPVADRLRDMLGAKSLRYFDRKNERAAVEKFYSARDYAPQWTQAGKLTDSGKGVIARLKDAASDGLNPADYPVPDFAAADLAGPARRSRTETDRQHARLCAPGAERPDALVAGLRRHPLSRASDRSGRSAGQHLDRQGRFRGARRLQPAAQALQGTEGQARRTARPGRRTGDPDRRRPGAGLQGRAPRSSRRSRRKIRACRNCAPSSASPKIPTTRITTPRSPPPCANSRRAPTSSRPACSTTAR